MNEQKKHDITLYTILAIAIIALVVGSVGLLRNSRPSSQTPQAPTSSSPSSSQLAPPPGTNIQSVPSGSNLNSSGDVGR